MDRQMKKILSLTLIPTLLLSFLDLTSTYLGVCVFGGIELNPNAIKLIQNNGFILAGVLHMVVFSVIGLLLGFLLWKVRKDEIGRTMVLVIIVLFLTELSNTVVLNLNNIMYIMTGKSFAPPDEQLKGVTPMQAEQIGRTFDRQSFCRLI